MTLLIHRVEVLKPQSTVVNRRLRSPSELARRDTGRVTGLSEIVLRKRRSIYPFPFQLLVSRYLGEMNFFVSDVFQSTVTRFYGNWSRTDAVPPRRSLFPR